MHLSLRIDMEILLFWQQWLYYTLLDKARLQAFIHWIVRNGINKIKEADDMSNDSAENLIQMFEQIFQSKKNEVFVSMKFGDSQSELIFEKGCTCNRIIQH